MKERPILFSGPMVRAIMEGHKSQTRRAIRWPFKGQPAADALDNLGDNKTLVVRGKHFVTSPYGEPGDRLWVRETWASTEQAGDHPVDAYVVYRATDPDWQTMEGWRWRPAIFMPRTASRLMLEVTDLRVERLQDISEKDAAAEGLLAVEGDGTGTGAGYKWNGTGYHGACFTSRGEPTFHTPEDGRCACKVGGPSPAQCAYRELWDFINGKRAPWNSNPWVWVVEFKAVSPNHENDER